MSDNISQNLTDFNDPLKRLPQEIADCIHSMHSPNLREQRSAAIKAPKLLQEGSGIPSILNARNVMQSLILEMKAFKNRHSEDYAPPQLNGPLDIVYIYLASPHNDAELRFSLRSVERHMPYVRKIWIFGDRPAFLTKETSLIEHIPESIFSNSPGGKERISNDFLLQYFASHIPNLAEDYLLFCDDMILLKPYSLADAVKQRYISNMAFGKPNITMDFWEIGLWQSCRVMVSLGYTGYNFAAHVPIHLTRKRVFEAYHALSNHVFEHDWCGLEWTTGILNHIYQKEGMQLTDLYEENSFCGFYNGLPTAQEIVEQTKGKQFLNFNDNSFGPTIQDFLIAEFPLPSRYEA